MGDDTLEELDDGTTTEEVIMVLMDRLTFLNAKLPSAHNTRAIFNLRRALDELHARTADRVRRGVEGTAKRLGKDGAQLARHAAKRQASAQDRHVSHRQIF